MARKLLLTRYASNVMTALELAGFRLDCYSTLGDTITTDGRAADVIAAIVKAGGEVVESFAIPNRFYAVARLGTQIVSVKQATGSILVDVLHWSPLAKIEKVKIPIDTGEVAG